MRPVACDILIELENDSKQRTGFAFKMCGGLDYQKWSRDYRETPSKHGKAAFNAPSAKIDALICLVEGFASKLAHTTSTSCPASTSSFVQISRSACPNADRSIMLSKTPKT